MRTFGSTFNFKLKTRDNLLALFLPCAVPFLILAYISCKKYCKSSWHFCMMFFKHIRSPLHPLVFFLICRFQIWESAHSIYLGLVYSAHYSDPSFHQFSCKWWFFFFMTKWYCVFICLCVCVCVSMCLWMCVSTDVALHFLYPFIHNLADFILGCCRYYCNKHEHGSLLNSS